MSVAASEGYHATQKKYVYSGSSKGSGRPPRPGLDRPIIRKLLEPIRFLCLSFETNVIPHASLIIAHHRETGKNPLINPDALPFPPPPPFLFYLFNWTYRNKRRATTRNYMGNKRRAMKRGKILGTNGAVQVYLSIKSLARVKTDDVANP